MWTVPCFKVLSLEFLKLELEGGLKGFCKPSSIANRAYVFPIDVICTSYCNIKIRDTEYTVLWEWHAVNEPTDVTDTSVSDLYEEEDSDDDSRNADLNRNDAEDEENENVFHTLPFKVLGVAHSRLTQNHLEQCFLRLQENLLVQVKVQPEPANPRDSNAIAVLVNYGTGSWFRVGYIPHELTHYVHQAIDQNKLVSMEVQHVKFRVHWLRVGFYMKLLLTKIGAWDDFVVRKSATVR